VTATRCYEHTIIARQDLSPQQAQTLAETYAGVIGENGGEVTKKSIGGCAISLIGSRRTEKVITSI